MKLNNKAPKNPLEPISVGPVPPTRSGKPEKKKKRWVLRIFLGLLFITCVAILSGVGIFYHYAKSSPKLKASKLEALSSTRVFDKQDNVIYELGQEKREAVEIEQVPKLLKQAIISIEDKRFDKHIGVDPIRIIGAAISNFRGNDLQGGSTLTQQLIKLSFFTTGEKDQTISRKIQEAWMSIQLERQKSKDEVLNYYINKVYMSNRFYGMETAAKGYYGVSLADLTIAQTALLAGMPQAPYDYDPIINPELSKKRRDLVLSEMEKDKVISSSEYEEALKEPIDHNLIKVQDVSDDSKIIDNYIKQVIEEVQAKKLGNIYTDGMDIYTNLDMNAQKYLYHLVNSDEYINYPDDEFQVATTVIDPKSGQVRAQLGARKVPEGVQLGENFAVSAQRDFGSTVKPITDYAPAIEYLNYSTGRYALDGPYNYPGTKIAVNNYDRAYRGNITIREALVDSRNTIAAKTLEEVTKEKSELFLNGLGLKHPNGIQWSSAIQGDFNSLGMASAYGAFANGGIYYKPYYVNKIVFADGREETYKPEGTRAMKDSTAYMVTDMLKDVLLRGTGTSAIIPGLPQAGKTGTSNYDEKELPDVIGAAYGGAPDITFVGYSTNYSIAIWTGYKSRKQAISPQDQQIAMEVYKYLMGYISQNLDTPDWQMPDDVVQIGSELYLKDHTADQNTWKPSSNTYVEPIAPPASSSSYSSSSSSSSSSSTIVEASEPPVEPSKPPVESSTIPPVTPPPSSSSQPPVETPKT